MSHVKYTGTSDFQVFNKSDFEKAGVDDQGKVTFAQGEPTEVSDAAAEALTSTSSDDLFGDFSFVGVEVDEDGNEVDAPRGSSDEEDPNDPPKEVDESVKNPGSRADQTDTDTATGGGTTTGGTARGGRGTTKKAAAGNRSSTRSS